MATNFKISAHRNDEVLHLTLKGDFDGTSAHELLDVVRKRDIHIPPGIHTHGVT